MDLDYGNVAICVGVLYDAVEFGDTIRKQHRDGASGGYCVSHDVGVGKDETVRLDNET